MHGREGEEKNRRRHMLPGPALGKTVADSSGDSFCKDGRKISVGDCALFQAGNSPPFIGIIRWLSSSKEDNNLKLGVNWLYRPADVKLGKGILLEAAPNEVFYSFHKDEIPAASLLHPCKVAFLRKGVELPTGISSFVCRRVYDIANKCLWWLTDQDYIDERQEEVDQLLDKTRLEMHAAVQSGGRSPKPLNGPTSTQQLKPSSDSVQNSSTSFNSQVSKSKKNKRGDQGSEPIKRERLSKPDDGDSGQSVSIKAEIAKVIDKEGGLISFEGVEKLVNLMLLDKAEKKIDFASRKMLADVIAATERFDCLGHFVHLSGVPVLDDWLQEAHKGKIGDGNSPKESDKSIEELLLSLLRALDKLPVNLHALQTCNVGKSVNHLRSHKNLEIQRKARSLVDTWKKRVEAEMKMNDAKSGPSQAASWPGKPSFPEVTHGGNRRPGSSETALKNSSIQPSASKTTSIKLGHVDPVIKSASSSPGSVKLTPLMHSSVTMSSKGATDQLLTTIKEEKSSSSSQSQNNSQSCSSDHAKTVISAWKEDARSSTAGSISASINKNSTGVSRTRRSSNGFMGSGVSGVHKEAGIGKSGPTSRNTQSEKISQSGLTCERTLDMPGAEHGSSHRLIVRLPNPGRSPAHSATGGSLEDLSVMSSRASSPGVSEKLDPFDRKTKVKRDLCRATNMAADINTESWQSNDLKNGSGGSDECDRSPATLLDDEQVRNADEFVKPVEISKGASSSGNEKGVIVTEPKPGKPYESSFKSMNALIESCVKQSEVTGRSLSAEDDVGMNLLASVAAGEVSKSEMVLPVGSPQKNPSAAEGSLKNNNSNAKLRLSRDDGLAESYSGTDDVDPEERCNNMGPGRVRNESEHTSSHSVEYNNTPGDSKGSFTLSEHNKPSAEEGEQNLARRMDLKSDIKLDEVADHICQTASTGLLLEGISADVKEEGLEDGPNLLPDKRKKSTGTENLECVTKFEPKGKPTSSDETKMGALIGKKAAENSTTGVASDFVCGSTGDGCERDCAASSIIVEKEAVEQSTSCPSFVTDSVDRNRVNQGMAQHLLHHPVAADPVEGAAKNEESLAPFVLEKVKEETKPEKVGVVEMTMQLEPIDNGKQEKTTMASKIADGQVGTTNGDETKELSERNEALDHQKSPSGPAQKSEQCLKSAVSTSSDSEPNEADECASSTETSSTAASDDIAKLDFDLNEGFPSDEGNNQGDPVISAGPKGPSNTAHLSSLLPLSASPLSTTGLPSSITVAAAAKGPFVPPESLLRSKVELGWKGSAATSAFRPAEPRKVPEMPLSAAEILSSDNSDRKPNRPPLDIDLNVTDERVLEDMASRSSNPGASCKSGPTNNHAHGHRSTGMLDLDLNKVDEGTENGHFSVNTTRKMEVPLLPVRPSSSNGFPNSEVNILRDFDLNNGPGLDEAGVAEPTMRNQQHHSKSNVPFMPPIPGLRMNNTELGSISSWFPPGNSFPAVAIPSFLPDRVGEQPYPIVANSGVHPRILGSATSGTFGGDLYPAPVLSSSATMTFTPAFPYGGFPLGNSFPLASTSFSGAPTTYRDSSTGGGPCFPAISSQLVGPSGSMSSHYPPRPYVISLPEVSTTSGGAESSWKWGRQGLDLNAGLGSNDVEGRNERLSSAPSRQLLVAGSQALAEEQARMYQVKRKEPDGGRDVDRFTYKQPSWQ